MKRRVELARALIHDAKVVILDEPTVGLDAQSRSNIWTYLRQLKAARGFTLIVTTHYIEEVDEADRVCIIDHGRILALDAPSTLRAEHGREIVRVVPRDAAATAAIRARFPTAEERDGDIAIIGADSTVTETLLRDFGPQIRNLSYDRPSLESVFLALTGREIRDQPATRGMRG